MRKIILFLLLLAPLIAFSQSPTPTVFQSPIPSSPSDPNYNRAWGQYYNLDFPKALSIPVFTNATANTPYPRNGQIGLRLSDTTMVIYYNGTWYRVGGSGGGAGSVYFDGRVTAGLGTSVSPITWPATFQIFQNEYWKNNGFIAKFDSLQVLNAPVNPNGVVRLADIPNLVTNIYNSDGTLTFAGANHKRTVTIGTDSLLIVGENNPAGSSYFQNGNSIVLEASQGTTDIFSQISLTPGNYNNAYSNIFTSIADTIQMNATGAFFHVNNQSTGNPIGFDINTGIPGIEVSDGLNNHAMFYNTHIDTTTMTGQSIPNGQWVVNRIKNYPHGTGTVGSVALSLPSIFTVSGSPVTTTGTLTGTLATQTTHTIWGNNTGSSAAPVFFTPGTLTLGYGLTGTSFNDFGSTTTTADTSSSTGLVSKSRLATNLGGYLKSATAASTYSPIAGSSSIVTVGTLSAGSIPYSLLTGTPATGTSSVSNSDGSLTISPTSGSVVASLNTANTNTFSVQQNINFNTGTSTTQFAGTTPIHLTGANAGNLTWQNDVFAGHFVQQTYYSGGTQASPTAATANSEVVSYSFSGGDGTSIQAGGAGSIQGLIGNTNWTTTNHPTQWYFNTTPTNSTTETKHGRLDENGLWYFYGNATVHDTTLSHNNIFGYTSDHPVLTIYTNNANKDASPVLELYSGVNVDGTVSGSGSIDWNSGYNTGNSRPSQISMSLAGSGTAHHYASSVAISASPDNGSKTNVATFATGTSGIAFTQYTTPGVLTNNTSGVVSSVATVPTANGGLNINTAPSLGSLLYGASATAYGVLAPNTTATQKFLTETGTGSVGAIPAFFDLFGTANTFSSSVTASAGIANGQQVTGTLTAAANNDVLAALNINPTYTNGAFTGVENAAIKAKGDIIPSADATYFLGTATLRWMQGYFNTVNTSFFKGTGSGGAFSITTGGSTGNITYSLNSTTTTIETQFNTTGDALFQKGGTQTDNGYMLQANSAGTAGYFNAGNFSINTSGNANLSNLTASMGVGTDASKNLISVNYATVRTQTVTSASTLSAAYGVDYVFTGTTSTYTLPAISAGTTGVGNQITIYNKGSGSITVNSNAGGNDIYKTSAVATFTLTAGSFCTLTPDGTNLDYH